VPRQELGWVRKSANQACGDPIRGRSWIRQNSVLRPSEKLNSGESSYNRIATISSNVSAAFLAKSGSLMCMSNSMTFTDDPTQLRMLWNNA